MEHPFTNRTPVRVDVELRRKHSSLGCYRTRDIDSRAVFIEAPMNGLCRYDVVEMIFLIDQNETERHRLKGIVIRCDEDGVAVVFVSEATSFLSTLDGLLVTRHSGGAGAYFPQRHEAFC